MTTPHIWVPRARLIEPVIHVRTGFKGLFRLFKAKVNSEGEEIAGTRRQVAQSPNMVVDSGLNVMGTTPTWFRGCHVGTGTGTTSASDASLQNYVVGIANKISMSLVPVEDGGDVYIRRTAVWRFPQGTFSGENVTEVGITQGSTNANAAGNSNFTLWCRSLVVDSNGDPVAVTVLADEILEVEYECRLYVPTGTVQSQVNVNGTPTDIEVRAANANSTSQYLRWWYGNNAATTSYIGSNTSFLTPGTGGNPGVAAGFFVGASSAIGPTINDSPTGTRISSGVTAENSSYVASSHQIEGSYRAGLDDANDAAGVGALVARSELSLFQIGFSPRLQKTSDDILNVDVVHSWGRR